jgi:hypothetical protein
MMQSAEPLRDQHFNWLSQKLITRLAKDAFCLQVQHLDPAGSIDHHHCVRGRFHCPVKAFAATPELILGALLLCQVSG